MNAPATLTRPPAVRHAARLVVVTPARNEAAFLHETIRSVVGQTVRPACWVIVDDGSTDGTGRIAAAARDTHDWIRLVERPRRAERRLGGGVVEAFEAGLAAAGDVDHDYLCKLDGDLRLGSRYFERLLDHFARDPRLGTLSGKCYLAGPWGVLRPERTGDDFSLGAAKFYRRQCYEAIGGFVHAVMWDGIDCHRCRMLGWKAMSIDEPDLRIEHLRPMGASSRSIFEGRLRHGRGQHFMGTHPLYMLASGLCRMAEPPLFAGGLSMIAGYLQAALARAPRYADPAFRRHLRRWQMARLLCPWRRDGR